MSSTASLPIHSRAPACFVRFSSEFSAAKDLSRYRRLSTPNPITGSDIAYLNYMQINGFIPTKTALLLKNNNHDIAFMQQTLLTLIEDMHREKRIGTACREHLSSKLRVSQFSDVLEKLYVIMLYSQISSSHDDLLDGTKKFETVYDYSDMLVKRNLETIAKEKRSLEKQHRVNYLCSWLVQLSIQSKNQLNRDIEELYHDLKNNPINLKPRLLTLIERMQTFSSPIESICLKELYEAVSTFSEAQVLDNLYLQLKTDDYYRECVSRVKHLKQDLSRVEPDALALLSRKIDRAYNGCVYLLKDSKNFMHYSQMRFSANIGKMRAEWQEIQGIFNRVNAVYSHKFCGCQGKNIQQPRILAEWPYMSNTLIDVNKIDPRSGESLREKGILQSHDKNQNRTVAVIGCEWGGGHREVSRGIANMLNQTGYHPVTVNLPDVLKSHDPVRKTLGENWSIARLFNALLSHKAYALINVLRSAGGGAPDPVTEDQKLRLVLQHLLKINPSSIITTYSADNELIIKACNMLGIPCIHIATDIDSTIETRTTPPDFKHFYMGLPFDQPECIQPIQNTTTADQRVITGPPVRHEFTLPRTKEQIDALKKQWGIPLDKRVIVISNGKNGSTSPYPRMLAERYRNTAPNDIPISVVVLTGQGNIAFKDDLDRNVIPHTHLPMQTLAFANPQQMEELMAMASYGGGLIGKTGGGTFFEASTRGTRLCNDNLEPSLFSGGIAHFFVAIAEKIARMVGYPNQMVWEKANMDFGRKHGIVVGSIDDEREFFQQFDRMINNDGQPVISPGLKVANVEDELSKLLDRAYKKVNTDFEAHIARQEHDRL